MVKRVGGLRRKTRHLLRNNIKARGKISITKFFQQFNHDDRVILKLEPSYPRGMFYKEFQGKVGKVTGMQGKCYTVEISDHGNPKELIVHPIHLKLQR